MCRTSRIFVQYMFILSLVVLSFEHQLCVIIVTVITLVFVVIYNIHFSVITQCSLFSLSLSVDVLVISSTVATADM